MANTMTSFKAKMLWDSISRGDLSAVHGILETGHVNLEERDQNGCTFLMAASESGDVQIVRELLQIGVDPNAVDNENWSALLCACKQGHLEVVIELLEHNADMEHSDMCGWSALMWGCYKGRTHVVSELLERGANPNIKADHNMTCLSWAAGRGHIEIAQMLMDKGAKINVPDKYGTTPLIWACRKGHADIVEVLLGEGASADASGMNSWTPLLVATKGGHLEVVRSLLTQGPNANASDKDGLTSLAIAAKEGFSEIVNELLSKGAYVNVQDRTGDSILIHAVKGGHVDVVRALLKKYVDSNVTGQDGKTALYCAVEKGYTEIVRLLLQSSPDLEISTKDEDTPLLRAVRTRNEECVRMLLEKGAKVSASDKRGDTALHISIRARSKRITELLLRNPRHSRLLYRLNKSGESPYSLDTYHQRGILPQIYGHGNLNATDAENLLGYEIYSSALADILSEPGLITPLILGLYAKWGSGKSFLLDKLTSEMKVFTRQNKTTELTWSWLTAFLILMFNTILGEALGLAFGWQVGLAVGLGMFPFEYGFIGIIILVTTKYDFSTMNRVSAALGRRQRLMVLFIKMLFCLPKKRSVSKNKSASAFSVRFLFSESTRLTSVGGEKSLAAMIGTLCDSVEKEYGTLISRLFRVFKHDGSKSTILRNYKSICCVPYFLIVLLIIACIQVGVGLAIHFGVEENVPVDSVLIGLTSIVGLALVANLYTWGQMAMALIFSQKRRVTKAADNGHGDIKMEGFMQQLKKEVDLLSRMVNCMDGFTGDQTRLVVIVDGLDSCEQTKVLQVLDTVKSLFSDDGSPFVTVLAVDPHIIIKGIEQNLRSSYQDTNVNGFDYLRNVVHLPFYLQSQGLRIQHVEHIATASHNTASGSSTVDGSGAHSDTPSRPQRMLSHDSTVGGSASNHMKNVRAMGSSSKVGGSISGSLPGIIYASSFDIANTFARSDYFSDINPRSMRRLMNIVAVTARLLRAYNIDFKWQRLAAWINLIEQWPYRLSWIIYVFEESDHFESNTSLYKLYERIVHSIPATKEQDPLLEIDRNVRKLEAFLTSRSGSFPQLSVGDLRKFLPCTTNLDPYLRKLIRENQHNLERQHAEMATMAAGIFPPPPPPPPASSAQNLLRDTMGDRLGVPPQQTPPRFGMPSVTSHPYLYGMYPQQANLPYGGLHHSHLINAQLTQLQQHHHHQQDMHTGGTNVESRQGTLNHPSDFFKDFPSSMMLSKLSVEEVCGLIPNLRGLSLSQVGQYQSSIQDNNISGLVLTMCDLMELQPIINMKFGDWQLFRSAVSALKEYEKNAATSVVNPVSIPVPSTSNNVSTPSNNSPSITANGSVKSKDNKPNNSHLPERGVFTKPGVHKGASITRKDSVLQQMSFETAILKSAVSEFMEESEEEVEEMEEFEDGRNVKRGFFRLGSEDLGQVSQPSTLYELSSSTQEQSQTSSLMDLGKTETSTISKDESKTVDMFSSISNSNATEPGSVTDISSFITVLDEPGKCGYGSSEFVPFLGKSSSLSTSSDRIFSSASKSSEQTIGSLGSGHLVSTHKAQIESHPQHKSLSMTKESMPKRQMSILQQLHRQPHVSSLSLSRETSPCDSDPGLTSSKDGSHAGFPSRAATIVATPSVECRNPASPLHSITSSIERLAQPILSHIRPPQSQSKESLSLGQPALNFYQDDLVNQSKSTVVEMELLREEEATNSQNFHTRLGQAFDDMDRAGGGSDQSSSHPHMQPSTQHQSQDAPVPDDGSNLSLHIVEDKDKESKL